MSRTVCYWIRATTTPYAASKRASLRCAKRQKCIVSIYLISLHFCRFERIFTWLRRITYCMANDFAYCCTFLRSVVRRSVCRLSHSCVWRFLLPFDRYALSGPVTHCVRRGRWPLGEGETWRLNPKPKRASASNLQKNIIYNLSGGSIDQWFRFLLNYFFCLTVYKLTIVKPIGLHSLDF